MGVEDEVGSFGLGGGVGEGVVVGPVRGAPEGVFWMLVDSFEGRRGRGLAVDCYVDVVGIGTSNYFCAIGVEILESGHGKVFIVQPGLVQELDSSNSTSVHALRELFGQVAKNVQASIYIGSVACKQHGADQAAVVLSVLRSRSTMKVDHDLQAYFLCPVHGLYEVGILSGNIRLVVSEVDCPVSYWDAYSVEACCFHVLEVIAVDEGTITGVRGIFGN